MRQPSKIGPVFLVLFSLPFLGGGLALLYTLLISPPGTVHGNQSVGFGIAFLMTVVGVGIGFGSIKGYGMLKERAEREEANPGAPWLWRTDWAARRAESSEKNRQIGFWILCILGNAICIPMFISFLPMVASAKRPEAFLSIGFGLLGLLLFVAAVRASMRAQRFGKTYFEFNALPFSPGQNVSGRIHLKMDAPLEHGIDLRLVCERRTITGSGKNQTTNVTNLWEGEQNVQGGALAPGPLGRAIPIAFAIPADAYVTDQDNSNDQVLWKLFASANIPGVDYKDSFELPVFRTTGSAMSSSFDTSNFSSSENYGTSGSVGEKTDSGDVPRPEHVKVRVTPSSDGTEFYFRPFRNPATALFLLTFSILWTGVVYLLFHSKAPVFFAVIFGFFDVLIVWIALQAIFGSALIAVGNGKILSRSGILGMGKTRRIPVSDITSIVPVASIQQGNTAGTTRYTIRLRTKNGLKLTLADGIDSRMEARWIVSQLESLAGLTVDTHVEADSPFGPPPQPGQTVNLQDLPLRARMIARPQGTSYAPVGVFLILVGAMFGFMFVRMTSYRTRASNASKTGSTRPATTRSGAVPRKTYLAPMTDEDESRVIALPPQAQAEELTERALQHDLRALEMFEREVSGWTGELKSTATLKQLETRTEFSKDLRVRYANADLNLAMQGWQKNEASAEQLIEQARTDVAHREWALYYLGMLGGRGVDYDHIHSVLLDYAKHDPNPSVRQWAVEGMRYLGKDDVLDELFESFTQDPSFAVRDRAGCNISDCGNFMRKQRMRMVPQLIDLAANPQTNAQMKNWCFMALQGITDASVRSDATAWRNWYSSHGAQKMAEFEKLDWWVVRGDE
jgi:hypothetical protein